MSDMEDTEAQNEISADFRKAWERFQLFERLYLCLGEEGAEYLRNQSRKYKGVLRSIRDVIQPAVVRNCSTCEASCCQLSAPDISIYMASTVGGFRYVDYMLARCDTLLPEPRYKNVASNLCPFWSEGCTLPVDCRSFTCVKYFCDGIEKELDMGLVSGLLEGLEKVIGGFSTSICMA